MKIFLSPRVRVFRYRELLLVLVLVAVAAWAFSGPGREVLFDGPALRVTVVPGPSLEETVFEVRYQGPEKYQPAGSSLHLQSVDGASENVMFKEVEEVGPGHWRARGRDMRGVQREFFKDTPAARPRITGTTRWKASVHARDSDASPHSRGAKSLRVQSEPFILTVRE